MNGVKGANTVGGTKRTLRIGTTHLRKWFFGFYVVKKCWRQCDHPSTNQCRPMNYLWNHSIMNTLILLLSLCQRERFGFHGPAVGVEHLLIILSEKKNFSLSPDLTPYKRESIPLCLRLWAFQILFFLLWIFMGCFPQYLFSESWKTRDVIRCSLPLKPWLLLGTQPTVWGGAQKDRLGWLSFRRQLNNSSCAPSSSNLASSRREKQQWKCHLTRIIAVFSDIWRLKFPRYFHPPPANG